MAEPANRREQSASDPSLQDQMDAFERENPKVAEAIRLFGMSLSTYQGALHAMQGVRITQTDSTKAKPDMTGTRG